MPRRSAPAQLAGGEKGRPVYDLDERRRRCAGTCWCSPAAARARCRAGAGSTGGRRPPRRASCDRLAALFGAGQRGASSSPTTATRSTTSATTPWPSWPPHAGLPTVATNNVHYATPGAAPAGHGAGRGAGPAQPGRGRRLAARRRPPRTCAPARRWRARFARATPARWRDAAALGARVRLRPARWSRRELPPFPVPPGHTEASWLRELTCARGAASGTAAAPSTPRPYAQIDHELDDHRGAGLPRLLPDRARHRRFCRAHGHPTARAGARRRTPRSATRSASPTSTRCRTGCCSSGSSSPERDGPPDIDVDIESDRREEVIQYVYASYGRRARRPGRQRHLLPAAVGGARRGQGARVLAGPAGRLEQADRPLGHGAPTPTSTDIPRAGASSCANELLSFPRHLGIHSGGMVICDRPVIEVCPVEWARMTGRTVLQWDKDDCAAVGLVKFDLLGLGMLSALHYAFDLVAEHDGVDVDLHELPPDDPEVYEMLCAGRLGRGVPGGVPGADGHPAPAAAARVLRPGGRGRADPARPDPGRLGAPLHPARATARSRSTYAAPAAGERAGEDAGGAAVPGAAHADGDRRRRLHRGRGRPAAPGDGVQAVHRADGAAARPALRRAWRRNGITGELADEIYDKLAGVRQLRLPGEPRDELRLPGLRQRLVQAHHPAAFCAALLSAQPMGFYSPQSLVADARRHGVQVRRPDVNASGAGGPSRSQPGGQRRRAAARWGLAVRLCGWPRCARSATSSPSGSWPSATRDGPYRDLLDLARRVRLHRPRSWRRWPPRARFGCFGLDRREALWAAGAAAAGAAGPAAGHGRRARRAGAARDDGGGADGRRRVGHRGLPGQPSDPVHLRDRSTGSARCRSTGSTPWAAQPARTRSPGAGRRAGHPPAAAGDRGRGHVPQPGGRDRHAQRHLLGGAVAALPDGGAGSAALLVRGRLERSEEGVLNLVADRLARLVLAGAGEVARLPLKPYLARSPRAQPFRRARRSTRRRRRVHRARPVRPRARGPPAGGRVWRGRRFVDCTFHDADLRGLVTEQCSFDGCRVPGHRPR